MSLQFRWALLGLSTNCHYVQGGLSSFQQKLICRRAVLTGAACLKASSGKNVQAVSGLFTLFQSRKAKRRDAKWGQTADRCWEPLQVHRCRFTSAGSHWSKEVHTNILKWPVSSVWPEMTGNEARSKEDAALFPIHVGLWWTWQSWFVWLCMRVKTTQCLSYINHWTSHWRGSLRAKRAEPRVCLLRGLFRKQNS